MTLPTNDKIQQEQTDSLGGRREISKSLIHGARQALFRNGLEIATLLLLPNPDAFPVMDIT